MKRNHKYVLSLIPGLMVLTGNLLGGWWVLLNTFFSLGVLAILENFVHEDKDNEAEEEDWFPDGLLVAHVILQTICIATVVWSTVIHDYSFIQLVMLSLSVGINSGASAIVIAHELIHRKDPKFNVLGQYLLFTAGNIYFFIDHLKVHHKWVGTLKDPATSRYGENVYSFFVRSFTGQIRSAFQVEANRLKSEGKFAWSIRNYVVACALLLGLFYLSMMLVFGWKVLVVLVLQGFFANFLLEYTNYIEHYGLSRNQDERVTEIHSWQTDKVISRFFLIDLSRHADHHYYASKPYHTLKSYENSPLLPGGYVSMIYYALIPPLFFRKIHPLMNKSDSPSGISVSSVQ
jgi:alkane 1-monooxygenase